MSTGTEAPPPKHAADPMSSPSVLANPDAAQRRLDGIEGNIETLAAGLNTAPFSDDHDRASFTRGYLSSLASTRGIPDGVQGRAQDLLTRLDDRADELHTALLTPAVAPEEYLDIDRCMAIEKLRGEGPDNTFLRKIQVKHKRSLGHTERKARPAPMQFSHDNDAREADPDGFPNWQRVLEEDREARAHGLPGFRQWAQNEGYPEVMIEKPDAMFVKEYQLNRIKHRNPEWNR